jgi:site-specific DNA-methyltransferase (adenine-specific)
MSWQELDRFLYASEIAWQQMIDAAQASGLDEILCDPQLAAQFDLMAGRFAPGYSSLEYRWAALKLRKEANTARGRGHVLTPPARLNRELLLHELNLNDLPDRPGVYILSDRHGTELYAGETRNLRQRLTLGQQQAEVWSNISSDIRVQVCALDLSPAGHLAWQSCLISKQFPQRPRLNYSKLRSV